MKSRSYLVAAKSNSNCCLSSRVSFLGVLVSKRTIRDVKSQTHLELCAAVIHLDQQLRVFGRGRMTQTQMTAYLADKIGITKRQAKSALDELNELVTRQLKKEGLLRLAGLGVFRKRRLKARVGRNPATGEQIKIPARTRLRFTPAKALKDSVLGAR
jgi:DNA-binding protein HU-beta